METEIHRNISLDGCAFSSDQGLNIYIISPASFYLSISRQITDLTAPPRAYCVWREWEVLSLGRKKHPRINFPGGSHYLRPLVPGGKYFQGKNKL